MNRPKSTWSYRGPLRAALFDWAGTIVDYGSRAPVLALTRVFDNFGIAVTNDEVRGPMGMAKRDHIRAVLQVHRVAEHWRRLRGTLPDELSIDEIYLAFLQSQRDLLLDISSPIPGAIAAIDDCRRRGMKVGSSTGYTSDLMKPLVEAMHREGLTVDAVVCADDVPQGRPAPWLCLENARRLEVFPVQAMVAIDDTSVGIAAGLHAGMWTIGVARSGNSVGLSEAEFNVLPPQEQSIRVSSAKDHLLSAGAHLVVDTVADLPKALDSIEACIDLGNLPEGSC